LAHASRLKRGVFRPMMSRLINLLRAGPVDVQYQGAAFRFYHQASATERGALFNPSTMSRNWTPACADPGRGVFVDVGACRHHAMVLALMSRQRKSHRDRAHPITMRGWRSTVSRPAHAVTLVPRQPGLPNGECDRDDGDNLGASHIVSGELSGKRSRCRRCDCSVFWTTPGSATSMREDRC